MSGGRRVQRSVRIAVAAVVLGVVSLAVGLAVASSTWVRVAAVAALAGGVLAARILYAEVVQTRQRAAREHATQARSFGSVLAAARSERLRAAAWTAERVDARDRRILDLEQRLGSTETRLRSTEPRLDRESRRADDAHTRLNELLDQVLARMPSPARVGDEAASAPGRHSSASAPDSGDPDLADNDRPSVVDLLTWEAGASTRKRPWRREA